MSISHQGKRSRPPLLTRVLSFVVGCAMWALWLWLIIPAPISEELRRRIVETSLTPSLHVVDTLAALYVIAVASGRSRKGGQGKNNPPAAPAPVIEIK
jgi:hypothetical protein